MNLDNYLEHLKETSEGYSVKVKKYLIQQFIENGIATKRRISNEQLSFEGMDQIDISNMEVKEQFTTCINGNTSALHLIEKWEFIKDYKYSVLFTCDNFKDIVNKTQSEEDFNKLEFENEYLFDGFVKPIKYEEGDNFLILKFNIKYSAVHPLTQEELLLKYPFLVVFHKNSKVIEFRFDVLKRYYLFDQAEEAVYSDLISKVITYIRNHYLCELKPLKLDFLITVCKSDENVKLIAQYMKLPNGGNAQLEVGNNQEYVLPFIGELRTILNEYNGELEKIPQLKDALEQFMYEKEEMSDYPWIELLWENEIKTRGIRAKFIFNYRNNEYCLIQHYYNSVRIGMERMNDVTKYIIDHRENNEKNSE